MNFYYRAEEADAYMDHLEARIAELGAREEALARLALGVLISDGVPSRQLLIDRAIIVAKERMEPQP